MSEQPTDGGVCSHSSTEDEDTTRVLKIAQVAGHGVGQLPTTTSTENGVTVQVSVNLNIALIIVIITIII